MHKTFERYKQNLIDIKTNSMLWEVIEETKDCFVFQSIINRKREERFSLHKEWSEKLTEALKKENCVLTCEGRPEKTYYAVVYYQNCFYNAKVTISQTFDFHCSTYATDEKGHEIRFLTKNDHQLLKKLEKEILQLILQDNTIRLAVVSGALHSAELDLLSMID